MKKLLLLLVAIVGGLQAQIGYHIQLSSGISAYFLNKDSVYMSIGQTNKSHMMLINPNTKDWKYLNSAYLPNYGQPVISDKNNGAILLPGSNGVHVTTNGWQSVTNASISLTYMNKGPGGYYGLNNFSTTTYSIFYSSNGLNWSSVQPAYNILGIRHSGNKVYAVSGGSQNYVSTNGGQTYSMVANTGTFTGGFVDFLMASPDTFVVAMKDKICRSNDGGATWTNTPIPNFGQINSVAFKNKNEFAATSQNSPVTFSYTTNGGQTWAACTTTAPTTPGGKIMYNNNYYYLFPSIRTNDYGATWDQFLPPFSIGEFDIDFNNSGKGLAGGQNGNYAYTNDYGRSFKYSNNTINSNQDMMAVKALNNGTFLGGDRKGQVYTSSDNGQTWIKKNSEFLTPNAIRFLTSANENTIVLCRTVSSPVVSIDGGATFSVVVTSISGGTHLQALKPNGEMLDLREINGWEARKFDINGNTTVISTYSSSGTENVVSFKMADDNVGYIITKDNATKNNKVYRTTDSWVTYTVKADILPVITGTASYDLGAFVTSHPMMHTFGPDTVIVTGDANAYYHISVNGGNSWTTVTPAFAPAQINRMHFFTSSSYVALTTNTTTPTKGVYMNHLGSGGMVGIHELNFDKRVKAPLVLFPNPASGGHAVSILDAPAEVQVNVYNLQGALVKSVTTDTGYFSIEGFAEGLYIVNVQEKNKAPRSAKLIVRN